MNVIESIDHEYRAIRDVTASYVAFTPPTRMRVSDAATEYLKLYQPGGSAKPWARDETPYMVEPTDIFASRQYEASIFVGPARTGKTAALLLGGLTHAVVNDPGDMLMVQMTQDKAREFSKTDIDRALRYSPKIREFIGRAQDDNTHDKTFKGGMWLRIGWPTAPNFSGTTYRYVMFTDYDRMPDDIDGEGSGYMMGLKRTTTFMSRGMCMVESSPGRPIEDPSWRPVTPHEAPPTTGILGLYNQTDRRRYYWQCTAPKCGEWFEAEPGLKLFGLPSEDTLMELVREANLEALATEHNRIVCPHCDAKHGPRSKYDMNLGGRWVKDGQILTRRNELVGDAHDASVAGFWLGGAAAAYQSWRSIILRYLNGLREYSLTGSEVTLQTTTNTDQGMPYTSQLLKQAQRDTQDPAQRAEKEMVRYVVPDEARFIVAAVDVQGGTNSKFVVQVHAVGPNREKWVIDRYNIVKSNRQGIGEEFAPIDPAAYKEDWDLITERVVRSTYRTSMEGKELRVRLTVVDSGGEAGVTGNAYDWYRRIRQLGLESRVMLIKGVGRDIKADFPFMKISMKGARNPDEEGDIPLYLLNSNTLKDNIDTGRKRSKPGPAFIHIPAWLPRAWWDEFYSEVRQPNGVWKQVKSRNEAFDCLYYCEAGCLRLAADKFTWEGPNTPSWARPLVDNSDLITREDRREENADIHEQRDPITTATPIRVVQQVTRQTRGSSYLGRRN